MEAKFETSLKQALISKDYITANLLIEEEKFSTKQDKLSEKCIKEIVLKEIYNASNKREYSNRFLNNVDDNSFHGIGNKILAANPNTRLNECDLYFSTTDDELGVDAHFKFKNADSKLKCNSATKVNHLKITSRYLFKIIRNIIYFKLKVAHI